jgi:phosphoserine phosphatase
MRFPLRDKGFASVVFDCDSTLVSIEGIDELAGSNAAQIRELTDAAMEGSIALEEVYGRRLAIIRPTRDRVEALGREYVQRLVEDARETIAALTSLSKEIRVVSGGLLPPVRSLATELGIPSSAVAAVDVEFATDGTYAGFDHTSPLARSGGKTEVIRAWALDRPSLLVGDGSTDLEARGEVDLFVAYMGVAYRQNVAASADLVLHTESLAPVLALAANEADRRRLASTEWAEVLRRGDEILERQKSGVRSRESEVRGRKSE